MDMDIKDDLSKDIKGLKKYAMLIMIIVIAVAGYTAYQSAFRDPAVKFFQTDPGSYYLYLPESADP